jgi:competence protein ComEC
LAITTPLVAATFHVVSPIGLIVNLLLIPAMAFALCAGFLTLFAVLLLPQLALIPGAVFSGLLMVLTWAVDRTAQIPAGHIYIADLPVWTVPVYYVLILAVMIQQSSVGKTIFAVAAMSVVATACLMSSSVERSSDLHLTVLDIGHGSAAVLEFDNYVLLLDAGALNRGEQAADIICGFLWSRGIRQVNGVVLSHADMDHYNAFPGLPGRLPIAEIITTRDFVASPSPSVQGILEMIAERAIPVRIATHGDVCNLNGVRIELLQADSSRLPPGTEDNEKSLVVSVRYANRHLVIPGDLEGRGLTQLLPQLGTADVLVSPHHGSRASNTQELAATIQPQEVIVSARSSKGRFHLENVFADAQSVRITSEAGAVRTTVRPDGTLSVSTFRQGGWMPANGK